MCVRVYRYNAAWRRGMWSCGILVTRREKERPTLLLTTSSSQYIIVYNLDIITRSTRARTTQTLPLRIKIHICIQVSSSLYYYYYSVKDICLFGFLFWHKSVGRQSSPDLSTSIFDVWQNDYNYQRVPECHWWQTNWRRRVCSDWISLFVLTFTHLRRKKRIKRVLELNAEQDIRHLTPCRLS